MKNILAGIVAATLLAGTALPATAQAQETVAAKQIVVTGKHKTTWEEGSALERKGLTARADAQRDLAKANRDVIDAQTKRDTNREKAENAAEDFRQLTATMPNLTDASEASAWAKKVDDAADRWAKADRRGDGGSKDLRKAMKEQTKAQSAVKKAQAMIDKGGAMKADAEQLSLAAD